MLYVILCNSKAKIAHITYLHSISLKQSSSFDLKVVFAATGRSLYAEDRQGGPSFSAPSFNIPFQPNFEFNEFGNFIDSNGGFGQIISGLGGGQSLNNQGDFVSQTEQRFNARPISGAAAGAPFKRETELNHFTQSHQVR